MNSLPQVVSGSSESLQDAVSKRVIRVTSASEGFFQLSGSASGQYSVRSYYEDGKKGGGLFYYSTSTLKSEHNGFNIFSPTVPYANTPDFWAGVGETDPGGSGCFVRISKGTITASECGLVNETLEASTRTLNGTTYNVQQWTQSLDALDVIKWFADSTDYSTFTVDSIVIYVSFVVDKDWSGKTLEGVSRQCSGIIDGNFVAQDGTKQWLVKNLSFYGLIGLFDVPLPITGDPALETDPAYFYIGAIGDFGWGFGAITIATASVTGNTNDVVVEDCYFEMRGGTISGGSAPDDEDRPKVTNVVFRNNVTRNCFYHGAAGIHFQNMRVHDNLFQNQYYGYAVNFSLGCVECHAYRNVSIGDCSGGMKAEARDFELGNFGCTFEDNIITVQGGNGFNLATRASGRDTKFRNNIFFIKDYTGGNQNTPVFNCAAPRCEVTGNEINILSVSDTSPLKTIATCAVDGIAIHDSVSVVFENNTIRNYTTQEQRVLNLGTGPITDASVSGNTFYGAFASVASKAFSSTLVVDNLNINNNSGDLGSLYAASSAVSIDKLIIKNNTGKMSASANNGRLLSIAFTTINDVLSFEGNTISADSGVDMSVLVGTTSAALAGCRVTIANNTLDGLNGALAYLFQGGSGTVVDLLQIAGNNLRWTDDSGMVEVQANGVQRFIMQGNTIVNDSATGTISVVRPTDGANSIYVNNVTIGSVSDSPL
jgi:hypothetical protein